METPGVRTLSAELFLVGGALLGALIVTPTREQWAGQRGRLPSVPASRRRDER